MSLNRRKRPCEECPFRRDVQPGQFPAERYEGLRGTAPGPRGESVPYGAPMFACHKSAEGQEIACSGWLAVCGRDHVTVRVAIAQGALTAAALEPADDWPALFDTYEQMAAAQASEVAA